MNRPVVIKGRNATVKGRVEGEGFITVSAQNRSFSSQVAIAAGRGFEILVKLFPGRNVIVLQAKNIDGMLSRPKRVIVRRK